jgi:hypothetical protein
VRPVRHHRKRLGLTDGVWHHRFGHHWFGHYGLWHHGVRLTIGRCREFRNDWLGFRKYGQRNRHRHRWNWYGFNNTSAVSFAGDLTTVGSPPLPSLLK